MNRRMEFIEPVQSQWVHFLATFLAFAAVSYAVCYTLQSLDSALHRCAIQRRPENTRRKRSMKPRHTLQLFTISPMEVSWLWKSIENISNHLLSSIIAVKPGDEPKPIPIPSTVSKLYGSVSNLFSSNKQNDK